MSHSRIALLVIGFVLLAQAAPVMAAAPTSEVASPVTAVPVCNGRYEAGGIPSPDELAEILKQHAAWLRDAGLDNEDQLAPLNSTLANDPRRANLCEADLRLAGLRLANLSFAHLENVDLSNAYLDNVRLNGADLEGANLENAHLKYADLMLAVLGGADLQNAYLENAALTNADLTNANLGGANLTGADLEYSALTHAALIGADLSNTDLSNTDLSNTDLNSAKLNSANLYGANLYGANLTDADLTGANLSFANVAEVNFDFDPGFLPKVFPGIYTAQNLQLVKFRDRPAALFKLRGEFKGLGLRTQEAQLSYAIRRSELSRKIKKADDSDGPYVHSWSERAFNTLFFDWTCQYGMSPGRPLLIVAALAVILSIVYIFAQIDPGPNGGIWAVWDEHRVKQAEGTKEPQQLTDGFPSGRSQTSFLLLAFYFSLLSATRIGWHELNVGTWITRIQPREYALRATGWVRVVSGVQSLISVYLVALAILTYFGTPFEY